MSAPHWTLAMQKVPDLLPHLRYMGQLTVRDVTVYQYKHTVTCLYLNLDSFGRAWRLTVDSATGEVAAHPIAVAEARRALGLP